MIKWWWWGGQSLTFQLGLPSLLSLSLSPPTPFLSIMLTNKCPNTKTNVTTVKLLFVGFRT